MNKKLTALIIAGIFLFGTVAIVKPVQAHFTLGDLTGTYRYHANDFDPHVPGVIGYVWPGGGQNTWEASRILRPTIMRQAISHPIRDRNHRRTPGVNVRESTEFFWYQLEGDAYAPFGAVLTGSTGDLIFALNATYGFTGRWTGVRHLDSARIQRPRTRLKLFRQSRTITLASPCFEFPHTTVTRQDGHWFK